MTLDEVPVLAVIIILVIIVYLLGRVLKETQANGQRLKDIESHQLNPRTRIGQARMDNGPETPTKVARQAGQVSRGKRVVVGGDPESALNQILSRQVAHDEEENDG